MSRLCSILGLYSLTAVGLAAAVAAGDVWPLPSFRTVVVLKPEVPNPFRRILTVTEAKVTAPPPNTDATAREVYDGLQPDGITGVALSPNHDQSKIVVKNNVFGIGEEIVLPDGNGGFTPLLTGRRVVLVGVTSESVIFAVSGRDGLHTDMGTVNVTVPLDPFFCRPR